MEKVRREKTQVREKVGKTRNTVFCGSGGSKSRLAKAAGAEISGQMRKEKLHAVVARSTFGSKECQNTSGPDHFWKLRCRKSARHCGAKHISKSKCTQDHMRGPLLDVAMSKKCTPSWREAYLEVNMSKLLVFGPLFDDPMAIRCRESVRRCGGSQMCQKLEVLSHFVMIRWS